MPHSGMDSVKFLLRPENNLPRRHRLMGEAPKKRFGRKKTGMDVKVYPQLNEPDDRCAWRIFPGTNQPFKRDWWSRGESNP